jgi:two-component system sensor histidine kinase DesK
MARVTTKGGPTGWGDEGQRPGRFGVLFIAIWTLFLLQPLGTAWRQRDTVSGWVGMVFVLLFGAWYLAVFVRRRQGMRAGALGQPLVAGLGAIAVGLALAVGVMASIGQDGTATGVYVCVLCAMTLPNPWAIPLAVVNAFGFYASGLVVPGWHHDSGLLLSMLAATLAVWGIQQMLMRNYQLSLANDENRRLVVSEERNRFARDLHDILGHSLTVITVKAELAQRLMDVDPERARAEVNDLERLSRDALADVRRAVEGYRELTLPGEITRARTALKAAEIEADLPNSTDEVPSDLRELFAWTIREGVTNVIRHSGARRCTVRLTTGAAEVLDDGCGPCDSRATGSGLLGLRERASAFGATVVTRPVEPRGFSLRVVVP